MEDQERIKTFVERYPASTAHITDGGIFDADLRNTSPVMHELGKQTKVGDVLRVVGLVAATGDDHRPHQMVITSDDQWNNERITQIAKDVTDSAMSVELATMMMAVHMREMYAYHRDSVTSLDNEVNRLMALVNAQEVPQEYIQWCRAAMEVIELGCELMPLEQFRQWTAVRAVQESCPVQWPVK